MKALTIYQPWASLIACGAKKYETRSWETSYRGPVAIHAAAKPVLPWFQHEIEEKSRLAIIKALADERQGILQRLPLGAVIATAELVNCWAINKTVEGNSIIWHRGHLLSMKPIVGNEFLFGDWTPGRYAWEFADVKLLPEPVPMKGKQGLWEVSDESLFRG